MRVLGRSGTMSSVIIAWCAAAGMARAQEPRPISTPLTSGERELAISLAGREIVARGLRGTGPLYATDTELLRTKDERGQEDSQRHVLVTHYRYQGDLAIMSAVDLTEQSVVQVDTASHVPTHLAAEEFENARRLALADSRVRSGIGEYLERVTVEALLLHSGDPADSLFGQRVVRLLFRVGRDYLTDPVVLVNLHREQVAIEQSRR